MRIRVAALDPTVAPQLSGGKESLAASLDYALDKMPNWMLDMFGLTYCGNPIVRQLLGRTNASQKRPGPVIIGVRRKTLLADNIRLILNDRECEDLAELKRLLANIESKKDRNAGLRIMKAAA